MRHFIRLFILSIIFLSCKKDDFNKSDICDSEQCVNYFETWKSLLAQKNDLTIDYVEEHLKPNSSRIIVWVDGESFSVCYSFQFDWLDADLVCDSFIIKIDQANDQYPNHQLPKGIYLTEAEVGVMIALKFYNSYLNTIAYVEELKYNSPEAAHKILNDREGGKLPIFSNFEIRKNGSGYPELRSVYYVDDKNDKCKTLRLNLVTGNIEEIVGTNCGYYN
jgi:hypothetical protein